MKKTLPLLPLAVAAMLLTACRFGLPGTDLEDEGLRITETFEAENFNAVSVSQGINIIYTQGTGTPTIKAEAAENVMPLLRITADGGTLHVCYDESVRRVRNVNTIVRITAPALAAITVSSGADFKTEQGMTTQGDADITVSSGARADIRRLTCTNLSLTASSGADAEVKDIKATNATATASSGSSIHLSGTCKSVNLTASSGADIDAAQLPAESGNATATSGADIEANVSGALHATKSSGGTVTNQQGARG